MRIFILIIFSISISGKSYSQYDTLSKYSYLVCPFFNNEIPPFGVASGFFLRRNNKLFFITNYHVASGFDPAKNKIIHHTDSFGIRLINPLNKKDIKHFILDFKRNEIIEDKMIYLERADFAVIEVSGVPKRFKIFDVSNLIDTSFFETIPDKVIIYGYPADKIIKIDSDGEFVITGVETDYDIMRKDLNYSINIQNQYINAFKKINILIKKSNARGGFSGSPVFGLFKVNKKPVIKLMGITVGQSFSDRGKIGRIDQIIKEIDQLPHN